MKILCVFVLCLLASCSMRQVQTKPELTGGSSGAEGRSICKQSFVQGSWQFTHSINFEMVAGHGTTFVGITVLEKGKLKTALLGVEGFVLFEAEQKSDKQIVVRRALAPFDKPGFAEALLRDVQTLFVAPVTTAMLLAKNTNDERVCRYVTDTSHTLDVLLSGQGWRQINEYDRQDTITRSVHGSDHTEIEGQYIPKEIELKVFGSLGYTLDLQLLTAEKLP
jgi:hypothetical protein